MTEATSFTPSTPEAMCTKYVNFGTTMATQGPKSQADSHMNGFIIHVSATIAEPWLCHQQPGLKVSLQLLACQVCPTIFETKRVEAVVVVYYAPVSILQVLNQSQDNDREQRLCGNKR